MILNGSSRPHAFTASLVQSFTSGAESQGHEVTVIELRKLNIHACLGCLQGGKNTVKPCIQSDDMDIIYDTYRKSDVIVFATPLFFWSYSGLLKNAMDRLWALAECHPDELHGNHKSGALLVAAGGSHPEPLLTHFDYLMTRLDWTNIGKVVLTHTDNMDMKHIAHNAAAFQLGASIR
ncbi:flavodoxin family protein [uncultured Megasphaera sp.]|uniref:flavodoxin family protein n=1 Tax=uncultured Megasphaera sp. TaxID=165188 RepID=UPI0025868021|nr:flavodoxin family protein [uncultured Megasphaera sp.]